MDERKDFVAALTLSLLSNDLIKALPIIAPSANSHTL
jgi:hypothetical protein